MVSVRRVAPVLLLVLALPLVGAEKKASSRPPRDLHRVGDHWTAYNPPDASTYPPDAKTYAIKHGDTLWGIAQRLLGNAYLWPQLWESNTWITDAHWIYPGDVLLIEGEAAKQAEAVAAGTTPGTQTTTPSTTTPSRSLGQRPVVTDTGGIQKSGFETYGALGGTEMTNAAEPLGGTSSPVALGTEADVYCYGYIGDPNEPMPNRITAFEDYEVLYARGEASQDLSVSTGNLVMIDGGTATGINPGETYLALEGKELVYNPTDKKLVGRQYEFRGQVRILCADERHARGIVTQSCMDIHRGARLKPLPQLPIPLAKIPNIPGFCDPSSAKRTGTIVRSQDGWEMTLGLGLLVEVNLGRDDEIQPGDFLTVYRENVQPGQERQVLGEIGILTTEAKTATGKIVAMRYHMQVGDRVEIR